MIVTCAPKGMSSLPLSEQDMLQSSWLTIIQPLESSTILVRCIRPSLINRIIVCKQVNTSPPRPSNHMVMHWVCHDPWPMTVSPPVLKNDTSSQYPSRLHSNPGVENKGPTPSPAVSLRVHRHYQDSSNTQTLKWCSQQLGWSCCCLLQTRERAQPDWIHCSGQKYFKFGKDSMFITLCGKPHCLIQHALAE